MVSSAGNSHQNERAVRVSPNVVLSSKYRLLQCIGTGGMGSVYKAEILNDSHVVAVKVLHPELLNSSSRRHYNRFLEEAHTASTFQHPNIAQVLDFGVDRGVPYIVMEYLDGLTLRDILDREGSLPLEAAVRITTQIAAALKQAHARRILHGDLKPENIIITLTPSGLEQVHVLDFGMARASCSRTPSAQNSSLQDGIMGTPQYMSPEQACGEALDAGTDIYSLGILVYEMLTGSPPFDGNSLIEILRKQRKEPAQPMKDLRPDLLIPETIEFVVLKALQKDPRQRQASIQTFLCELQNAALEAHLSWQPHEPRAKTASRPLQFAAPPPARLKRIYHISCRAAAASLLGGAAAAATVLYLQKPADQLPRPELSAPAEQAAVLEVSSRPAAEEVLTAPAEAAETLPAADLSFAPAAAAGSVPPTGEAADAVAIEELTASFQSANAQQREAAIDAAVARGNEALPALIKILGASPSLKASQAAAIALRRIKADAIIPYLPDPAQAEAVLRSALRARESLIEADPYKAAFADIYFPAQLAEPALDYRQAVRRQLLEASTILRENKEIRVEIEGHADTIGPAERNMELGAARARWIAEQLAELGVERERILEKSYGERHPRLDTPENQAHPRNDRARFILFRQARLSRSAY